MRALLRRPWGDRGGHQIIERYFYGPGQVRGTDLRIERCQFLSLLAETLLVPDSLN